MYWHLRTTIPTNINYLPLFTLVLYYSFVVKNKSKFGVIVKLWKLYVYCQKLFLKFFLLDFKNINVWPWWLFFKVKSVVYDLLTFFLGCGYYDFCKFYRKRSNVWIDCFYFKWRWTCISSITSKIVVIYVLTFKNNHTH
jgi:hypothetical protein